MLYFSPTVIEQFITVKVNGDFNYEDDESIEFRIDRPEGIDAGNMFHTLIIKNDDLIPIDEDKGVVYVDNTKHRGKNNGTSWRDAYLDLQDALDVAVDYEPVSKWKNVKAYLTRTEESSSSNELIENSYKFYNNGASDLVINDNFSFDYYMYNPNINSSNIEDLAGEVYYFNPGVNEDNLKDRVIMSFEYLGNTYDQSSTRRANVRVHMKIDRATFAIPAGDYATLEFGIWEEMILTEMMTGLQLTATIMLFKQIKF